MNIVIVANFTRDFSLTDNGRFLYLAKMLAEKNQVEIITADFNHVAKKRKSPITVEYPFKITMLRVPAYKRNISVKRFYSHYIWGKRLKKYLNSIEKPDAIYCAVPSLTGPGYVADYCHQHKVRLVIDIQDLWPEAFKVAFKIPVVSDLLFKPFEKKVNRIYSAANAICAVSDTYVSRALTVNKHCKEGTTVFLGTNLDTFDAFANEKPILEKKQDELWLAYCGTLGASYDLTCVIDALNEIKDKTKIRLIVMGDGPRREEFECHAKQLNVEAIFTGKLPYNQMCALLCKCDMTVNPIMHNAAQSIINKHGDYAASGLPVINTQECEEYRSLVDAYHMGLNCNNGDTLDLSRAILKLAKDETLRISMGKNARRCAEEKFDRKNSYQNLVKAIFNE